MANKQLTATVRLNTTQAEQKLRNISKAIDAVNRAVGKQSNTYHQVNSALGKTVSTSNKVKRKTDETTQSTKKWSNALSGVNNKLNTSSNALGMIGGKIKRLASTYLGVMGMGAIINTSDMITSSENKLNYVSAQQLGKAGYTTDASGNEVYSNATLNATQDAMDKMYASSQKVRMGYGDMMANVSKSMALAGDAFDNNTDKAIRFQEIMAEAYAVGGASAQEMSSSMYQLIQALGSGVLAGDELRSVREGAPLAYKEIEKFAQEVYGADKSLKEMASQGLITTDMVTAAIMRAGDDMDKAFAQTEQTFTQTWEQIKNAAIYAFKPISKMLRTALNDAIDSGLLQKVETVFANIAKAILIGFTVIKNAIMWVADNWDWLKYVVGGVLLFITIMLLKMAAVAIWSAIVTAAKFIWMNRVLIVIVIAIMLLIWVWNQFKNGAISACEAIVYGLLIVGAAVLLIGILIGSVPMIIIGAVIIMLAVIFMFFEQVCGGVTWLVMFIVNIVQAILGFIMGVLMLILAIAINVIFGIINGVCALWSACSTACKNIGIFFSNLWYGASASFWTFIGDVLSGLSDLEPAFNALAELFGLEGVTLSGLTQGAYDKADAARGNIKSYESVGDAFKEGLNTLGYINLGDAWSAGWNSFGTPFEAGWSSNAYNAGADWGADIKGSINDWGSQFQTNDKSKDKTSLLDNIGSNLGLDFSSLTDFPSATDPNMDLSNLDSVPDKLGGIGKDTGKIADSVDLTEEDLEYLRKIAEMEWKKEYTTASIKVDMSNYNTINGESDLDGLVTKLSDKLYEELNIIADGVYE